jgi:hypothetical protein
VELVGVDFDLRRDHRRHPRRPVDPRIPLVPRQLEHLRHGPGPVDQLALEPLQPQPALLGLEHLVDGARLHEGHATGRDRLAVLAQGVAHRAHRRLRHRLQRSRWPSAVPVGIR